MPPALPVICKHFNEIQQRVYRNSLNVLVKTKGVAFYECTNYYFGIEQEDTDTPVSGSLLDELWVTNELRKCAHSKPHQSAPPSVSACWCTGRTSQSRLLSLAGAGTNSWRWCPGKEDSSGIRVPGFHHLHRRWVCRRGKQEIQHLCGEVVHHERIHKKMSTTDVEWCTSPEGWLPGGVD